MFLLEPVPDSGFLNDVSCSIYERWINWVWYTLSILLNEEVTVEFRQRRKHYSED